MVVALPCWRQGVGGFGSAGPRSIRRPPDGLWLSWRLPAHHFTHVFVISEEPGTVPSLMWVKLKCGFRQYIPDLRHFQPRPFPARFKPSIFPRTGNSFVTSGTVLRHAGQFLHSVLRDSERAVPLALRVK